MGKVDELKEEMEILNYSLWKLLEPYTRSQENVLMASGVLMKTAIQLYTIVLQDEDIAGMMAHEFAESIPELRKSLQKSLKMSVH